ncbi:MAG: lysophospholipid acyltransferase family protein [Candidatus Omnitrophota bacterium]|jgi:KDO2-lipid IV(A) lauroyltransferase
MINYIFYRIGEMLSLNLPLRAGYAVAIFLSNLRYALAFKDRRIITENLKTIFPEKNDAEISAIRLRVFHNFAKYLIDFFRFKKLNIDYINKNIRILNRNYINEGLKLGKGVIIVTAHLGNWELGGVVVSMTGDNLSTVALPHKSKVVTDFFTKQRESKGLKVFLLGDAVKGCIKALRNNQVLALVGDRDFTGGGKVMDFFGKPSLFPEGPAVFSLHTGAVIIPGFMLRNEDDSFSLVFEKPLQCRVSGDRKRDLDNIISQYKSTFEKYIRSYPDQWYMFRRFWKE